MRCDESEMQIFHFAPTGNGGISSMIEGYKSANTGSVQFNFIPTTNGRNNRWVWIFVVAMFRVLSIRKSVWNLAHLHTSRKGSFLRKYIISLLLRLRGIDYIVHLHSGGFDTYYSDSSSIIRRLIESYFLQARAVIVLSESWKNFVENKLLHGRNSAPNVYVVFNPSPYIAESLPSPDLDVFRVAFAGKICEMKGVYDLISAIKIVAEFNYPIKLNIYGDGQVPEVTRKVSELGLSSVVQVSSSWIEHKKYLAELRKCSVFVLPSYIEGFPMSIVEALGQGVAVISTTVGGIPELLGKGERGILIEPGDISGLAAAIIRLYKSPDLRNDLRLVGHSFAIKNLTLTSCISTLRSIYFESSGCAQQERAQRCR